jgi:hypothetical protein
VKTKNEQKTTVDGKFSKIAYLALWNRRLRLILPFPIISPLSISDYNSISKSNTASIKLSLLPWDYGRACQADLNLLILTWQVGTFCLSEVEKMLS